MLNAAIELVVEQGAKVSMMAIGQRSGFSHGLVLSRFGSKAGLLAAVAREARRRYAEAVDAATAEATGLAKLHCVIDTFFEPISTEDKAYFILLGEAFGPDPHLREIFAREDEVFRDYVRMHLQEAQAIGEIDRTISTHTMAALIVGMLRGVASQYVVNPKAFELKAVLTQAHAFVAGLAELPSCS